MFKEGRTINQSQMKGGPPMTSPAGSASKSAVPTTLLKVGLEVFPVYGDDSSGFSMDADDLSPKVSRQFRYRSIDELFFALVNLNCAEEGTA
jgi:hypothetical protein